MKRYFLLLVALVAFGLPSYAQINIGAVEVGEASLETIDICKFRANTACLSHYGYNYYLRLPSSHPNESYYFYLGIGAKMAKSSLEALMSLFERLKDKTQVITVTDAKGEEFIFSKAANKGLMQYSLHILNPEFNPQKHALYDWDKEEGKHKYVTRVGYAFVNKNELQKCIDALAKHLLFYPEG